MSINLIRNKLRGIGKKYLNREMTMSDTYCLGSPPRIAVLTAGYKGLSRIVKIKSVLLLLLMLFLKIVTLSFAISIVAISQSEAVS